MSAIKKGKIEILQKVFFESGKWVIRPRSFPLLNAVAQIMQANPQINKVRASRGPTSMSLPIRQCSPEPNSSESSAASCGRATHTMPVTGGPATSQLMGAVVGRR